MFKIPNLQRNQGGSKALFSLHLNLCLFSDALVSWGPRIVQRLSWT